MGYLKELVICIDPAHYEGYNEGILSKYSEGTIMYEFAEYLKEQLEKYTNVSAVLTKYKSGIDLPVEERVNSARITGANCIISLHTDSNVDESVNEIAVYKSSKSSDKLRLNLLNTVRKFLGDCISYSIDEDMYPDSKLLKDNLYYFEFIGKSESIDNMDSYILVLGNHNNLYQCNWLCNSVILKGLAYYIAECIVRYYNDNIIADEYKITHRVSDINIIKGEDNNVSFKDFKSKIFAEGPEVEEVYNNLTPEYILVEEDIIRSDNAYNNKKENDK